MPPTMRPRPEVIKALRSRGAESVAELAARAGVDRATLLRIEAGLSNGRPATLRALAAALNVPVSTITDSVESVA